jgi:hypothetical protein
MTQQAAPGSALTAISYPYGTVGVLGKGRGGF